MSCSFLCRGPQPHPQTTPSNTERPHSPCHAHIYERVLTRTPIHSHWHSKTPFSRLCSFLMLISVKDSPPHKHPHSPYYVNRYTRFLPHPKSTPTNTQRPHSPCYAITMQESPYHLQIHSYPHSKTPLTMLCYLYAGVPPPPQPTPTTLKDPSQQVRIIF